MEKSLKIDRLRVTREGKEIVKGITLEVPAGEVHALMGPNGSGKSSLANSLMGHPKCIISGGSVEMDSENITALAPDRKARMGLFLSMQYPPEIAGVTVSSFLRTALNARREKPLGVVEFHKLLKEKMSQLAVDPSFSGRSLNEGFSGGEKKRMEILQLALLQPKYAVLDETDSGLDVDALKVVTEGINSVRDGMGILLITHYTRILKHLVPDKVHVMVNGKIVATGEKELADQIEKEGYSRWTSG